jgi:hypothetical protein
MTKQTIELDMRRGMAAQKATELRRLMSEVSANEELLRSRQKELEEQLLATPATTWADAADKARYLLSLYASSPAAQDPRRQMLIARVLEDFVRQSSFTSNREKDIPCRFSFATTTSTRRSAS